MIIFADQKPLGGRKANYYGMANEFLLMCLTSHIYFFAGIFDEKVKYEIGRSMLVFTAAFVLLNLYYFLSKGLPALRVWIIKSFSPETLHDLSLCLSYLKLRWVVFPQLTTIEEREEEVKKKVEAWLSKQNPEN